MNHINKSELFKDIVLYLGDDYDDKCEKVMKEIISIVCETLSIAEKYKKIMNPEFCIDYEYALNFSIYAMNVGAFIDISGQLKPQILPRLKKELLKTLKREFYIPIAYTKSEGKCCHTCDWYAEFEGVCTNGDSEWTADFRCLDDTCDCWTSGEDKPCEKKI